jgi:hypothetical protein
MKTFVIHTSDSTNADHFKKILMELKSVKNVEFLEKENWQMPGRPATEKELEEMAIEAEQSGFISLDEAKSNLDKLHFVSVKNSK